MPEQLAAAERQIHSIRRMNAWTMRIVVLTDFALGLGWLLGPDRWTSSPSFEYLRAVNIDIWSVLAIVVAALVIRPRTRHAGFAWGAFLWSFVGVLFIASIPDTQGWGGPFLFGAVAWLHVLGAAATVPPKYYVDTLYEVVRRLRRR